MTAGQFFALFATMLAIAIIPGPSDLLVVGRSIAAGFAHGVAVTAGIVAADYVLIVIAVLALGFAATESSRLYEIVRYGCGLYLIGLSLSIWCARHRVATVRGDRSRSLVASFAAGSLATFGDPRAIAFYTGLLPAFVDLTRVTWRETLLVMAAATLTIGSIKLAYAGLSARGRRWLENRRTRAITSAVGSLALILVGASLLLGI